MENKYFYKFMSEEALAATKVYISPDMFPQKHTCTYIYIYILKIH
jgi:hypothetical protein